MAVSNKFFHARPAPPRILTKTTPIDLIESGLVAVPERLAVGRYSSTDMRIDPELLRHLETFHRVMVNLGGQETGALVVNSCYRPRGKTCETDYGGETDKTDINGHWTGRAIDFTAEQTAIRFFNSGAGKHRDEVRAALFDAGFYFPWYWKNGVVGGTVKEHWHIGAEVQPWTQSRAYRGNPPPWYS